MASVGDRLPVLVAAAGEEWEAPALRALESAGVVVLKRCVDLTDLLASATAGTVGVVVLSGDLPGLDADAVMQLLRVDVRCVAVGGDPEALGRLGVVHVHPPADVAGLSAAVRRAVRQELVVDPDPEPAGRLEVRPDRGRTVVVHGPAGAPGRTLLATGLAAEHARRGAPTVLVDADPHGGAVAQHLGVLDEVSGLLSAARLVNTGGLDARAFARCRREVAPGLEVLTGLPRPDRWVEARPGVLDAVLERATEVGDVVVDTGFSLEDDADLGRGLVRNQLTLDAVAAADHLVVVGSAEPTGLARLARTLVDLRDLNEGAPVPVTVVVNRMRETLGWSRHDIVGMVEGYVRATSVQFVPDDRAAADRALVAGRSVVEVGSSSLATAVAQLHDAVLGGPEVRPRRSSAGRARWRCRRP